MSTETPWTDAANRLRNCGHEIEIATDKLAALGDLAAKFIPAINEGYIDRADVADRLDYIATAYGFYVEHGADKVQAALADGFDREAQRLDQQRHKVNGSSIAKPNWRDHIITAAELQRKEFPPISYVVPGLIPEGLSILAGRPKVGKSWLALDVGIAVAAERVCLGERRPTSGDVLYAALEDNPRRLQRRIDKILSPVSAEWPKRLTLATTWRRLDKGGVDDVVQWADGVTNPRLCILDILAGVRPIRTRDGYTEDYESLAALHRMANERGLAVLVLHHTRKMEAEDPIDTISGTLGLAGCADTALVIGRAAQGTTLYVRGRDIEEAEHAVNFDKHSCRWTILGSAAEVHRSNERGKILDVLVNATELLGPQQISDRAQMKHDNVRYLLGQMAECGEVMKAARGRYYHPNRSELSESPLHPSQPHKLGKPTQLQRPDPHCEDVRDVRPTSDVANAPTDLDIPPFLRRENPRAEDLREIRHPAISSGPDDDLADFAPDLNE